MIIYHSMIALILIVSLYYGASGKDRSRVTMAAALLIFGYIIFWVGTRNRFVDTMAYIRMFNAASVSNEAIARLLTEQKDGWGFTLLQCLFKRFVSQDYHAWLMFIAIITGLCVMSAFRRYSKDFFLSAFLFMASCSFTWMMNGIRQFIPVAILFAATPLLEKKKIFRYDLLVLLCSTIHLTCIMMIPISWIVTAKPWKLKVSLAIVGTVVVMLLIDQFTNFLQVALGDTKYADSVEQFAADDGVNPIRVLVYFAPVALAWMYRNSMEENTASSIIINMSLFTVLIYCVGVVTSGILIGRLAIYTSLYSLVMIPHVLTQIRNRKDAGLITMACYALYTAYYLYASAGFYYSNDFVGFLA